ncbi:MAG TPA: hypothetical protein VFF28_00670 [Candidatus Nanoarchaeia archaeon]|nr:hypothetical protein [Candidatus Nanoarchaeia archaeon]
MNRNTWRNHRRDLCSGKAYRYLSCLYGGAVAYVGATLAGLSRAILGSISGMLAVAVPAAFYRACCRKT